MTNFKHLTATRVESDKGKQEIVRASLRQSWLGPGQWLDTHYGAVIGFLEIVAGVERSCRAKRSSSTSTTDI